MQLRFERSRLRRISLLVVAACLIAFIGVHARMSRSKQLRMGSHVFADPSTNAPLERLSEVPTGPIRGAVPPDYLVGWTREPNLSGPARHLADGGFCGHGEPTYGVFDVEKDGCASFEVRMTGYDEKGFIRSPPLVEVRNAGNSEAPWRLVYDIRKHPAGSWRWPKSPEEVPAFQDRLRCPKCAGTEFMVSLGFEYPVDATSSNDVGWFAIAIQCPCGEYGEVVFSDETS